MKKRGLGIIIAIIVLVLIVIVVNFNLKDDSEEFLDDGNLNQGEITEDSLGGGDTDGGGVEEEITGIVLYKSIFPPTAKDLIEDNPDLIIIDVSPKYAIGHIPRAINYNLNDGTLDRELGSLDKQGKYLVYSSSDGEGRRAAKKLSDAGFQDVYMLKGSYGLWVATGYDIEKSFISGLAIFGDWD